jgi:Tol biopolymer transport system component
MKILWMRTIIDRWTVRFLANVLVTLLGVRALARAPGAAAQAAVGDTVAQTRLSAAPAVVGPGVISTPAEEFKATVSPDGETLLYVVADHQFRHMTIVESRRQGEEWQTPVVAAFSGMWRDGDPAFAPDGRTVVFISNRPYPGDPPNTVRHNFNIWRVERRPDGSWRAPAPLSNAINTDTTVFAPSLTTTGVLYFNRGDVIYRAEPTGSDYAAPQPLPFHGSDPGISSDERFILFDDNPRQQPTSDLFVSCRTASGWTRPSRFLEPINSKFNEGDPWVSADGRWMYFYSDRWTPAPDRAPRPTKATYAEVEQEAVSNIYNGSRNLYRVDLSSFSCPQS